MHYPAKLTRQSVGNYAVRFPDVPEALTLGDTVEEALHHAADALESALDFYFEHNRPVPMPSKPKRGQYLVELRHITKIDSIAAALGKTREIQAV